jgi:hypothetical protein
MAMDIFLAHLIQFRDTRSHQVDTLVRASMTYGLAFFTVLASSPRDCESTNLHGQLARQLCMTMHLFLAHLIQIRDTRCYQVASHVRASMIYGLAM